MVKRSYDIHCCPIKNGDIIFFKLYDTDYVGRISIKNNLFIVSFYLMFKNKMIINELSLIDSSIRDVEIM